MLTLALVAAKLGDFREIGPGDRDQAALATSHAVQRELILLFSPFFLALVHILPEGSRAAQDVHERRRCVDGGAISLARLFQAETAIISPWQQLEIAVIL